MNTGWDLATFTSLSAPPMRHFDGTKKGQSAEYRRALRKACISNAFQYSTTSSLVRYRADLDMKRVISDTDGGHFTDRPQGRRNRRSRRAIAASINFGQNRSKTFIFKMPWTSTCPLHHIFRPSKCPGPPYRQASGPLEPGGILSLKFFAEIEAKPSPFYFFVPPKICWHSTGPVLPTGSFLQQESLNVSSDKEERRRFKVCHDFAAS